VRGIAGGARTPAVFFSAQTRRTMFHIGLFVFDMIVKGVAAMVVLSATVRMICDGRVTIPLEIREVEGIKKNFSF
jgi:hypothetical protein